MKIIHALRKSDGAGVDAVALSDRSVFNVRTSGTCHSGIRLGSDGVLYQIQNNGGFSAVIGEWLIKGTAADHYVQHTITDGTLEVEPGAGWQQLNANLDYDNQRSIAGIKTTSIMLEISDDVSGVPVVASATHTYKSEQGNQ